MTILLALGLFLSLAFVSAEVYLSVLSYQRAVYSYYAKLQSYYAIRSALPLALALIKSDDPSVDYLSERWAFPIEFETQRGKLRISIYDEERYLNLNYAKEQKQVFERLFDLLRIDKVYLDRLLIWTGKKEGSYDNPYPIKRANLSSKEELLYAGFKKEDLMGKSVGQEFYPGLWSLTTVYSSGKVNINTAPMYVLMALDKDIDQSLANKLIERRQKEPFKKPEDLVLVEGFTFDILYRIRDYIDTKSRYFHIVIDVQSGGYQTTFEGIYDRQEGRLVYKKIY
ncbi:MAG: general secretion pathway protein GspK [Aquificota bacterium]|nr:MAG: general secretion pathway protein GspK [Aquificota bacterium]